MDDARDMVGSLDLEVDLRDLARPGRKSQPLACRVVRQLKPADLALLATEVATKPPSIKKLTDRHHGLARLLAKGAEEAVAGAIMGYSSSRVSILKGDPAFQELLAFYREEADISFRQTLDQLGGLSSDVVIELRERLEDEPEKFTNEELRRLLETAADRSGHGPSSKVEHNHTVNLAEKLNAARERALNARRAQVIDAEIVEEKDVG